MAITIQSAPASISAAWRPIMFETTSNRYASTVLSVTAVSSGTGGFARYAISSNTYLVGDIITGSAFTGLNTAYNVAQTVTVVNASWVETDLLFVATATGSGTMTRTNNNFQIKCETYVFNGEEVDISSTGNNAPYVTVNFSDPHGMVEGDIIYIRGTTSYNGAFVVGTINNPTSLDITTTYVGNETGNGRKGTLVGTKRQSAYIDGSTVKFKMNAAGHLQTSLSPDLIDSAPAILQTPCLNSIQKFAVVFTEEFDDVDGLLQSYDTLLSSSKTAVRAVWQHGETQSLSDYTLGSSTKKFLTKAPLIKSIRVGEEEQLSFLSASVPNWRVTIQKYDLGGNALTLVNMTLYDIIGNRAVIPINSNMFDNTISKFEVWVTDGSAVQMSEKRTFIVDYSAYKNPVRFHFENSLGGFDAYTFTGKYTVNNSVTKTRFKQSLSTTFAAKDRGATDISSYSEQTKEIFSSFLPNSHAVWLTELINSASVYTKAIGATVFTPVNLYDDTQMVYDSDMPAQLKVSFSDSNNAITLNN